MQRKGAVCDHVLSVTSIDQVAGSFLVWNHVHFVNAVVWPPLYILLPFCAARRVMGTRLATYGYRIHEVEVNNAGGRTALALDDLKFAGLQGDAYDALYDQLTAMKNKIYIGNATYLRTRADETARIKAVQDPTVLHPYMVVRNVYRTNRRIDVTVEFGKEGDYESLLSRDNRPPEALIGRAPVRPYAVSFHMPRKGTTAYMVSATKGRTYVGEALLHRVRVENQRAVCVLDKNDALVEKPFIRWSSSPLFDPGRIEAIIAEGKNHTLTVTGTGTAPDGAPTAQTLRITQQGVPVSRMDDLTATIRNWWERRNKGSKKERSQQGAAELGSLVSASVQGVDFEDGEIRFLENGKQQSITPNTIERLFIYPMGDTPPAPEVWQAAAAGKLQTINTDIKVKLDLTEGP